MVRPNRLAEFPVARVWDRTDVSAGIEHTRGFVHCAFRAVPLCSREAVAPWPARRRRHGGLVLRRPVARGQTASAPSFAAQPRAQITVAWRLRLLSVTSDECCSLSGICLPTAGSNLQCLRMVGSADAHPRHPRSAKSRYPVALLVLDNAGPGPRP